MQGNLLILGDSFCETWDAWPLHLYIKLRKHNKSQCECRGFPGGSWWRIKQYIDGLNRRNSEFKQDLEYAVIVHPDIHRPIQSQTEQFPPAVELPKYYDNKLISEDQLAISLYYKYIDNPDFQIWAFIKWAEEVETLFASHVKLLHLVTSQHTLDHMPVLRGQVVRTPLLDVASVQHAPGTWNGADQNLGFVNHFSPANNIVFAEEMHRIISTGATQINIDRFKP